MSIFARITRYCYGRPYSLYKGSSSTKIVLIGFVKMPEQQDNKTESPTTTSQQKAAQEAIEAARQMEQAKKEGDTKKVVEKAEKVVEATEKYLKEKLKQETEQEETKKKG